MKVYILLGEWEYEGSQVVQAYASEDKANQVLSMANDILASKEAKMDAVLNQAFGPPPFKGPIREARRTIRTQAIADLEAIGIDWMYDSFTIQTMDLID